MSMLIDALTAALGTIVQFDRRQYPSSVISCTVPRDKFGRAAKALKRAYALLAAEWATDETPFGGGLAVFACYRWGSEYIIIRSELPLDDPSFPSLTKRYVPAYRFERQIRSLMGVIPSGHPDMRPWIKFEDWPQDAFPLRKSYDASQTMPRAEGEYQWARAEGEGVYEIPVGPVHAGIIEPGHFRFQAVGETVLNLEERLGYVHKGIEKKFETLSWKDGAKLRPGVGRYHCGPQHCLFNGCGSHGRWRCPGTGVLAEGPLPGTRAYSKPPRRYRRDLQ